MSARRVRDVPFVEVAAVAVADEAGRLRHGVSAAAGGRRFIPRTLQNTELSGNSGGSFS